MLLRLASVTDTDTEIPTLHATATTSTTTIPTNIPTDAILPPTRLEHSLEQLLCLMLLYLQWYPLAHKLFHLHQKYLGQLPPCMEIGGLLYQTHGPSMQQ